MAHPKIPQKFLDRAKELYEKTGSSNEVARQMGIAGPTAQRYLKKAGVTLKGKFPEYPEPERGDPLLPDFPLDGLPIEKVISYYCETFEAKLASHAAHTWFPVKFKSNKPIGLLFVGDVHIDDDGCDWPALRRHAEICKSTEGIHAVNIGDSTNCWGGRLIRKYADQNSSLKTARRLVEWLLLDSGFRWLIWLYGNHEQMGDGSHVIAEMAKRHGTNKVVMHDWEARFVLKFPNGTELRVNCAHDFPGNSMWNPLHGPVKAVKFGDRIDLAVCGHKHNWAISSWELPESGVTPLMVRVRGYKRMDDYARKIGIIEQSGGHSILVVIDPTAESANGRMVPFLDIERGAAYLTWLREQTK